MTNPASALDRPALWLSLLGGSLGGLISVRAALWSALTHQPMDMAARQAGHIIGTLLGHILLPVLVALIARRYYFLWAALTVGVHLFWTLTDRLVTGNWPGLLSDLLGNSRLGLIDLLFFAGSASLIRFLVGQRRERAAAAQEAMRRMSVQSPPYQEGVWPPPPTRPQD